MARYDDEKLLGQIMILADVVEGTTGDTFESPGESYVCLRLRYAALAPADGPGQPDLIGRLKHEATYGDVDPDTLVSSAIFFIDDDKKGRL
jgi:hypothetical protein